MKLHQSRLTISSALRGVFIHWLVSGASRIASYSILAMTLLVTVDILMRSLLGFSTRVAVEMTGYLLVIAVFFGLAYTLREGSHIRITFLLLRLPARVQAWVELIISIIFLSYTGVLGGVTWSWWFTSFSLKTTSRTGLDIVVWPVEIFIPVGLTLISLLLAYEIVANIKTRFQQAKGSN